MINFKIDNGVFNFRVAGILFHDNKILVHRLIRDDFYAFPGGRVEMHETTENTIIREMKEELGISVSINRLLWVLESFFTNKDDKYHELCYYYLIECNDKSILDKGDKFYITEGKNEFEFRWIDVTNIEDINLYPEVLKDRIDKLPYNIERIVDIN
ncbi:DNA mismatch repair protein MutT [Vallitalea longa]|uniref:DNA mismatch repair protein MutT n=2 Tax=Vallitalea longa TaxID=2936439 RepID=A0A9W5Y952_9FIRM|nr:DNA mismatch repair protein MutT [Vallitalea longa]